MRSTRVGDLFIADTNNCRVREVPTRFGINERAAIAGDIYTVAGDGTCGDSGDNGAATNAELLTPADVAVDSHANLLIADTGNRRVREVAAVTGTNFGVAMSAGNIYTVGGSGSYSVYFGDGLPAASDAVSLNFPTGVALDAAGDLFVADAYGRAVREVPRLPVRRSASTRRRARRTRLPARARPSHRPRAAPRTRASCTRRNSRSMPAAGSTSPMPATTPWRCSRPADR